MTGNLGAIESEEEELVHEEAEPRELTLAFHGNARDYFRLWIVNLCLTLFTFGIYSAWAKVRRNRYFYGHTLLDGTPFQYRAEPIPILQGRLIAVVLLLFWYVGTHFSAHLFLATLAIGILLFPWVMVRSVAFNARYSAYRNMTFQFSGTYLGAAASMLLGVFLTLVTFGLAYPWAYLRVRRYFVERMSLGGVRAVYRAYGWHLAAPCLLVFGGGFVVLVVGLVVLGTSGVELSSLATPVAIGGYLLYALGYAYLQARIARVKWRNLRLGPLRFIPEYRARDFVWLYLTNAVAILGSLGLLIPWAAVRMHRYRVSRLRVEQTGSLSVFSARPADQARATGAEVADLFDFEVSL